jgi:excisionase family DNA binding protein
LPLTPTPPPPDRFDTDVLTITEVGARLRVSRNTVYRLIREGHLSVLYIGNRPRVPARALAAYIKRSEQRAEGI